MRIFFPARRIPASTSWCATTPDRRKQPENGMNRLYAVESTPTTTGMKAEHRLGLRASEIPAFAAALAQAVGVAGVNPPAYAWTDEQQKFLAALAKDLKANAGKSAVIPGVYQDPSVAALALAINNALGNVGKTVFVSSEPVNPAAQRSDWRLQGAGRRSECGQGGLAGDSERQSDLRRARRSRFRERLQQGEDRGASRLALRRDRPAGRTGTFPRRTIWSPGRMRAPTTARFRSCSR